MSEVEGNEPENFETKQEVFTFSISVENKGNKGYLYFLLNCSGKVQDEIKLKNAASQIAKFFQEHETIQCGVNLHF